jgi:hypothetical protein
MDFLNSNEVKEFIIWIQQILDMPGSFYHHYFMKKPAASWSCDSIYSALENYYWKFSTTDPESLKKETGSSFIESTRMLYKLSQQLKKSIEADDYNLCIKCCLSILEWGGVRSRNDKKVEALGAGICKYLVKVRSLLSNDNISIEHIDDFIIMNSGFAKIYSLLIDDFIIYDGRVGAAMGLLVRDYCEYKELDRVPCELEFAWGRGKESTYTTSKYNKRNPSSDKYKFPELMNNSKRHLENNLRANWLIKEIIDRTESKFNRLEKCIQLRALESALFMIGYNVNEPMDYSLDINKW